MKKCGYLMSFFVAAISSVNAQDNKLFKIKAGEDIQKSMAFTDKYRYPQFNIGGVSFLNGGTTPAKLNYSLLLGEMHFISPAGDTLSLANENTIKWVQLGNDFFYYSPDNGYLEVINDYPTIKLAIKQIFRVASVEKIGAYQQSSGVSSIKNYSILSTGNSSVKRLEAKGDVILSKEKFYFFIDQNNRFYKATKSNLLKIFAKNKKNIENYLKEESIDFTNEENLKKLLQYCSQSS